MLKFRLNAVSAFSDAASSVLKTRNKPKLRPGDFSFHVQFGRHANIAFANVPNNVIPLLLEQNKFAIPGDVPFFYIIPLLNI